MKSLPCSNCGEPIVSIYINRFAPVGDVPSETVDTGLDKNQAELGVLVLAVALKVLADGHSLTLH
jgi:hypothetical protein